VVPFDVIRMIALTGVSSIFFFNNGGGSSIFWLGWASMLFLFLALAYLLCTLHEAPCHTPPMRCHHLWITKTVSHNVLKAYGVGAGSDSLLLWFLRLCCPLCHNCILSQVPKLVPGVTSTQQRENGLFLMVYPWQTPGDLYS
jgi:hypothetical protein